MKRKEILPTWIRVFAWIFLIFLLTPLVFVFGMFNDGEMTYNAFGLGHRGTSPLHPIAIWATCVLTFAGITSFGILWGKHWAIKFGLFYGFIALGTSVYAFLNQADSAQFRIPIEPFLLVPFLVILAKRRKSWDSYSTESENENVIEHVPSSNP